MIIEADGFTSHPAPIELRRSTPMVAEYLLANKTICIFVEYTIAVLKTVRSIRTLLRPVDFFNLFA